AAHLLDGNIRRIAAMRDNYIGEKPANISSFADLVNFLNELNATWVKAMKRVSPRVIIELLEITGNEFNQLIGSLDPFAEARISVAWAGEEKSANWFDIAREYTEKWHHQQQIRGAVARPGIMDRELYYPVLDAFMRALPHTYRDIAADEQ